MKDKLKSFQGLYAIVDDQAHVEYGLEKMISELILESPTPVIQLRLKKSSTTQKEKLIRLAGQHKVKRDFVLILNDDISWIEHDEVDGVHLGQNDGGFSYFRQKYPKKILGLSTHNLEEAMQAQFWQADYIGCGALFPTQTKLNTQALNLKTLTKIVQSTSLPKVAIGGININNIKFITQAKCPMAAIISGLIQDGKCIATKLHSLLLNHT